MLLFIICLLIGVVGTGALYLAFSHSLERNNLRRNKRAISYLAPVFLSIVLILVTAFFTMPRLQDLVFLLSGNFEMQKVELTASNIRWLTIEIDDKNYIYNKLQYELQPGTSYQITALPNSRHIIRLEPIAEDTADGGENEPG
ncbi:MAG: hypothetical protein ACOX1T_06860 [Saccharofermentanales bacterium]|jgi:hypothetical protein